MDSIVHGVTKSQTRLSDFHITSLHLPFEPQGKPKNTRVGSLSLLQRIFLTQESNEGLLHCRSILYQLSDKGSPLYTYRILLTDILELIFLLISFSEMFLIFFL